MNDLLRAARLMGIGSLELVGREERLKAAVHEASHLVAGAALGAIESSARLREQHDGGGSYRLALPEAGKRPPRRSAAVVALAGAVGEQVVFGRLCPRGCHDDEKRAAAAVGRGKPFAEARIEATRIVRRDLNAIFAVASRLFRFGEVEQHQIVRLVEQAGR